MYGGVFDQAPGTVTVHQEPGSSTTNTTIIRGTVGIILHAFEPAPPCDPDL